VLHVARGILGMALGLVSAGAAAAQPAEEVMEPGESQAAQAPAGVVAEEEPPPAGVVAEEEPPPAGVVAEGEPQAAAGEVAGEEGPPVDPVLREAGERFDRGVAFYDEGNFGAALAEFQRAYELTGYWGVLYNLGQVSAALNRHVDAVRYFEEYLQSGGGEIDAARRAEVEQRLRELRSRLATLTVTVDVDGAEVLVDDEVVGTTPLPGPIDLAAGPHVVVARHPQYGSERRSLSLASETAETVAFDLTRLAVEPPPPAPPAAEEGSIADQWWFWTVLGVVVAGGAATAGVLLAEPRTVYTEGTAGTVDLSQFD